MFDIKTLIFDISFDLWLKLLIDIENKLKIANFLNEYNEIYYNNDIMVNKILYDNLL